MPATPRLRHLAALPLLLAALLIGSLLAFTPPADAALSRSKRVTSALDIVRAQKGDPYRYGAAGPDAFDCSGLIYYSYRKAGFRGIPRTSGAQAKFAHRIKRRHLRKGDFVFFHNGDDTARNVYHVGVFAGWKNGRRTIIHAPYSGQRVHRAPIWTNGWYAGTLRGL
jgi:cell wall-associated NlpC family hydrolase